MLSSAYDTTIEWIYYPFDKSEDFELSDGGQITLNYKGSFDNAANNPVVIMMPGQSGHSQTGWVRLVIEYLSKE